MGKGCIFSAIPVALCRGGVTLLSRVLAPIFTEAAIANLSYTGSVMIFCVGLNLVWGKKIKVANLLPTLVFAVLYARLFFNLVRIKTGGCNRSRRFSYRNYPLLCNLSLPS